MCISNALQYTAPCCRQQFCLMFTAGACALAEACQLRQWRAACDPTLLLPYLTNASIDSARNTYTYTTRYKQCQTPVTTDQSAHLPGCLRSLKPTMFCLPAMTISSSTRHPTQAPNTNRPGTGPMECTRHLSLPLKVY